MPRALVSNLALVVAAALAAALGGCSGAADVFESRDRAFARPLFETPDWAKSTNAKTTPLAPSGPVGPEDLVDAGGRCATEARAQASAAPAAAAAPQPVAAPEGPTAAAIPSYGSVAGDLASARMPAGPPPTPVAARPNDRLDSLQPEGGARPAIGGIALGMTECEAVRRAGQPSNVNIGTGDKGARKVVLTYLSGSWPGIYTFSSGRLQEIEAAPAQAKPAKPAPKKNPKRAAPKTATTERVYVQ